MSEGPQRPSWARGLLEVVGIQLVTAVVSGLANSDKESAACWVIAFIVNWLCIGWVLLRRRSKPTKGDLMVAKWSCPFIWLVLLLDYWFLYLPAHSRI